MAWYNPGDWDIDVDDVIGKLTDRIPFNRPSAAGPVKESARPGGGSGPIGILMPPKMPPKSSGFIKPGMVGGAIKPGPPNPLQEMYDKLAAIIGAGSAPSASMSYQSIYNPMSMEEMQRRAETLVSAEYDPQIAAIQNAMQQTETRANQGKTELGNMYQALAGAYEADVPKVQAQYDAAQIEAVNRQKQLQDALNQDYAASQATVNAEAAALNQGAAANEVNQGISQDQAFLTNLANVTSEQNNANLGLLENANVEYTRQGGRLAGLEGNNRQADLMAQLENYLMAQQGNMQGIQGQRQGDYAKYISDLQMQDRDAQMQDAQMRMQFQVQQQQFQQQQAAQAQAQQWQQLMDLAGLKMEMQPQGPSLQDQIAGARFGLDQQQAQFQQNQAIADMALKISEEQNISYEEALKFVQASLFPQTGAQ